MLMTQTSLACAACMMTMSAFLIVMLLVTHIPPIPHEVTPMTSSLEDLWVSPLLTSL